MRRVCANCGQVAPDPAAEPICNVGGRVGGHRYVEVFEDLVWAAEDPAHTTLPWHLMRRRGHERHVALCGAEMRFATTRYLEQPPIDPVRKCTACVERAEQEGLSYP